MSINIYNHPEKCGLEIVHSEDLSSGYDFDIFILLRHKETGRLFYATDSGCSCPTPFEAYDWTSPDKNDCGELTEEKKEEFYRNLASWAPNQSDRKEYEGMLAAAKEALDAMRLRRVD